MPRGWFERETVEVARDLLGQLVISQIGGTLTCGRIVEAEAYRGPEDLASHAARHRTGRSVTMREKVGIAYVYRSYGIHAMLNVIAHAPGETGAVLIRALEPVDGLAIMRARRGPGPLPDRQLCSGPGKLCMALGISLDDHGIDLSTSDRLWLAAGEHVPDGVVHVGPRIGISRAVEAPWRFFLYGNPHVSATRHGRLFADVDVQASKAIVPATSDNLHVRAGDG